MIIVGTIEFGTMQIYDTTTKVAIVREITNQADMKNGADINDESTDHGKLYDWIDTNTFDGEVLIPLSCASTVLFDLPTESEE